MALIGQAVLEKMFEIVNDDGRTPHHEYPISSSMSLWLAEFELIQSIMYIIVTCKYEMNRIKNVRENVMTPFFQL